LHMPAIHMDRQIAMHGGTAATGRITSRTLYPYFFSLREQRGIVKRIVEMGDEGSLIELPVDRVYPYDDCET
jgi:hypothetical protein